MTPAEDVVITVSTALTATAIAITGGRKMLQHMIIDVVSESVRDLIVRQDKLEERQKQHLDRQDKKLDALIREVSRRRRFVIHFNRDNLQTMERRLSPCQPSVSVKYRLPHPTRRPAWSPGSRENAMTRRRASTLT